MGVGMVGGGTVATTYTEGQLSIDLFDEQTKKPAWHEISNSKIDYSLTKERKMNREHTVGKSTIAAIILLSMGVIASGAAVAAQKQLPETTKEGLKLVKQTKSRVVYMLPDTDLSQYTKVAILDIAVAFKKNWERDYNRDEISLERRVTDNDVDRIKKQLAADFKKVFTQEVEKAGYDISTVTGTDVLILRPAILNLDVTSVDTRRDTGMTRSYTANLGQMTLYLELYDSVTSSLIARIEDAEAVSNAGSFAIANRVTNTAAANRVIKAWADELIDHLGSVTEPAASSDSSGSD